MKDCGTVSGLSCQFLGERLVPGDDRGWPPFDISNVGQFTMSIKLYDPPLRMHARGKKVEGLTND